MPATGQSSHGFHPEYLKAPDSLLHSASSSAGTLWEHLPDRVVSEARDREINASAATNVPAMQWRGGVLQSRQIEIGERSTG